MLRNKSLLKNCYEKRTLLSNSRIEIWFKWFVWPTKMPLRITQMVAFLSTVMKELMLGLYSILVLWAGIPRGQHSKSTLPAERSLRFQSLKWPEFTELLFVQQISFDEKIWNILSSWYMIIAMNLYTIVRWNCFLVNMVDGLIVATSI